jgi:hypothetical protein
VVQGGTRTTTGEYKDKQSILIWWSLETYMVINFRTCGISRGACKLAQTPTLNLKKKKKDKQSM